MEAVQASLEKLAANRRGLIDRLREITVELDISKRDDDIANVKGSSAGIAGGCLLLGSFLFPPLAVPGILMTVGGAGGKIVSSVARIKHVKRLAEEAQRLCEEDARLLTTYLEEAEALIGARIAVGVAETAMNALKASIRVLRHTFITVPNAAGRASLRALLPAAAVGPIRVLAGATAGIGMAFDIVSLINASGSLARNETDQLADKLREIANELEKELNEVLAPPAAEEND